MQQTVSMGMGLPKGIREREQVMQYLPATQMFLNLMKFASMHMQELQ